MQVKCNGCDEWFYFQSGCKRIILKDYGKLRFDIVHLCSRCVRQKDLVEIYE